MVVREMRSKKFFGLATVMAAAVGALLPVAIAAPAQASRMEDMVDVNLGGLSSTLVAGGRGDTFSIELRNNLPQQIFVRRQFVVRLDGLTPDGVMISRDRHPTNFSSTAPGEVMGEDGFVPLSAKGDKGDRKQFTYLIQFASGAPGGNAQVVFRALQFGPGTVLGTDRDTVAVRSGTFGTPSSSPSVEPTPSDAASPEASSTDPAVVLAPLDSDPTNFGADLAAVPVILYVLGAILVSVGGIILWLLLRRPRPALVAHGTYPTVIYQPQPLPQRRAAAPLNPTATMPLPPADLGRGSHQQPTDPWAT